MTDLMVILANTPRGPWELLLGVICLRLARGPGCRSELGIPWKPPKSIGERSNDRGTLCITRYLNCIVAHAHLDLCRLVAAIGGWAASGQADWVHSMWSDSGPA